MASKVETLPAGDSPVFAPPAQVRGLLLAWAPALLAPLDRIELGAGLAVGRSGADWSIADEQMSSRHFRVRPFGETLVVEDLGSRNGTFVEGERIDGNRAVGWGSLIRAGRCLFVAHPDLGALEAQTPLPSGMAGRFHGPALMASLEVAALTGKHVVIAGESGTGKELCARWLARVVAPDRGLVAHNCARFTSSEEAEATLFGVGRGVFSGVEARAGLLEEADGGVLFLDELHVLPMRIQQSLLRFVEDSEHARIGGGGSRRLSTRMLFGTNVPLGSGAIAPDLVARLYPVEVTPLRERRADVAEIFVHAVMRAAKGHDLDPAPLVAALTTDHFEALCLADSAGRNVRMLEGLASELVARQQALRSSGGAAEEAVRRTFGTRLADSPVARRGTAIDKAASLYERNRDQIVAAFQAADGNLSETERALRNMGLAVNRRWLAEFLRRWGIRT